MSLPRLIWVGPLTVFASVAAVLVVRFFAVSLLDPEPAFGPLTLLPAIVDTAVLVTAAVLVFRRVVAGRGLPGPLLGLIGWQLFTLDPIRAYRILALRVLLVSFLPDIAIALMDPPKWPYALVLAVMHVAAWAVCVSTLTTLGLERIDPEWR